MRVILAGQRSFGAAALQMLSEAGHDVAAVWAPDPDDRLARKARGEGREVVYGRENGPEVEAREADLIVGAHSHAFISRKARSATRLGAIGYHPSLLPLHRGRDAVRWAVHMGEKVTGGSVYWMTDNVDAGPLAAQEHVLIRPGWGASELWREALFPLGIGLLQRVLSDLDAGRMVQVPQDEACATWEPSWDRPPLFRPELPQIGDGPEGMDLDVRKEALV